MENTFANISKCELIALPNRYLNTREKKSRESNKSLFSIHLIDFVFFSFAGIFSSLLLLVNYLNFILPFYLLNFPWSLEIVHEHETRKQKKKKSQQQKIFFTFWDTCYGDWMEIKPPQNSELRTIPFTFLDSSTYNLQIVLLQYWHFNGKCKHWLTYRHNSELATHMQLTIASIYRLSISNYEFLVHHFFVVAFCLAQHFSLDYFDFEFRVFHWIDVCTIDCISNRSMYRMPNVMWLVRGKKEEKIWDPSTKSNGICLNCWMEKKS